MKMRITAATILAALALTGSVARAQSAATAQAPAAAPDSVDRCISEIKKPVDWLSWGGDLRIRNEYYNDIVTLKDGVALHEQDVIRFRGRVWASVIPVPDLSFNGRIAAEPREWIKPAFTGDLRTHTGLEWRYGAADNLNIKWGNIFSQPLTLTVGRQDILLGDYYDWWLVADGTPGDGSWSFFLDSVRLNCDLKEAKTKVDLIYIHQNGIASEWLPTFADSTQYPVTDQNEQGAILYVSNKSLPETQVDGYFIYKHDDRKIWTTFGANYTRGDNADIYTLGGKVTGTPWDHWQYSVEGAYQFGTKEDAILGGRDERDIDAFGAKTKMTYSFKDPLNNQLSLVGEFLSGDDPNSGRDEMFDVLWGRWPRWSELYIYSYINENGGRIAQLNNIGRVGPAWSCNPIKGMTASVMYNGLFAPEENPTRTGSALFSRDGNFRGHYLQAILQHKFNKYISGHLWGEWVWEGDYYAQRDMMTFLRAEIMFTF